MGYIGANAFAILLATAAGLLVGMLFEFGSTRFRGSPGWPLILAAVPAEAWLAAILAGALILAPAAGPGPWTMALASAAVIWVGFVLPTVVVSMLRTGHSARITMAHAGYWLAVMVTQAATMQAVGLIKPS